MKIAKPKKKVNYHPRLWKLVSEYVRRSAQGKCYTCGTIKHWKEMDAGHFIDKSICGTELYFDLRNVKCQCTKCNRYLSGAKDVYAQKLVQEYGSQILDTLFGIKQVIRKWNDDQYIGTIEFYKRRLKELGWG